MPSTGSELHTSLTSRDAHRELVAEVQDIIADVEDRAHSIRGGPFIGRFLKQEPLRALVAVVAIWRIVLAFYTTPVGEPPGSATVANESAPAGTVPSADYWAAHYAWGVVQGLVLLAFVVGDLALSWRLARRASGNDAAILRHHLDVYCGVIEEHITPLAASSAGAGSGGMGPSVPSAGLGGGDVEQGCGGDGGVGSGRRGGPASPPVPAPLEWSADATHALGTALLLSPTMPSMVVALRDSMWKWVPYSLLVRGDLVVLADSSPFLKSPGGTAASSSSLSSSGGSVFESVPLTPPASPLSPSGSPSGSDADPSAAATPALPAALSLPPNAVRMLRLCASSLYTVKEAPVRRILSFYQDAVEDGGGAKEADDGPQQQPTVFRAQLRVWVQFERWVCLGCVALALVLGLVRFFVEGSASYAGGAWARPLMLHPLTAALVCLPVARPFLFHAANLLQVAFLLRTSRADVDAAVADAAARGRHHGASVPSASVLASSSFASGSASASTTTSAAASPHAAQSAASNTPHHRQQQQPMSADPLDTPRAAGTAGSSRVNGVEGTGAGDGAHGRGGRASGGQEAASAAAAAAAPQGLWEVFARLLVWGRTGTPVRSAADTAWSARPEISVNGSCLTGTCDDAFSLVDRLGSLTVLTCINLGVLSESPPDGVVNGSIRKYIDQVCILTPKHSTSAMDHASVASAGSSSSPRGSGALPPQKVAVTVLDLQTSDGKDDDDRDQLMAQGRSLSTAASMIYTGSIYKGRFANDRGDGNGHNGNGNNSNGGSGGGGGGGGGRDTWNNGPGAGGGGRRRRGARNSTRTHGGIKFQDSNWRKHLSSLKPLGLSALVHSNPGRVVGPPGAGVRAGGAFSSATPGTNRHYFAVAPDFAPQRLLIVPYITRSPLHLEELAAAVGFSMHDLHNYLRHHSSVCVIGDDGRGPAAEHSGGGKSGAATDDASDAEGGGRASPGTDTAGASGKPSLSEKEQQQLQLQELQEQRRRQQQERLHESAATIAHLHKPVVCNHVMQDVRYLPNRFMSPYQCFLAGDAAAVIRRCSRFWDGSSADRELTPRLVQRLREQCSQWAAEGRNITAFAYAPTPVPRGSPAAASSDQEAFLRGFMLHPAPATGPNGFGGGDNGGGAAAGGAVAVTATDCIHTAQQRVTSRAAAAAGGAALVASGGNIDALAVPYQAWPKLLFRDQQTSSSNNNNSSSGGGGGGSTSASNPGTPVDGGQHHGSKSTVYLSYAPVGSAAAAEASPAPSGGGGGGGGAAAEGDIETRGARSGVFLGLTAAIPRLKPGIQASIEQLTECGIRFVFFSAGSFKKSKALAAKMGMDTGWNSSVSLAKTSSGDGWQDKARMPCGIEEIRRHLVKVDDVPLLVPLFTDSTPKTTRQMIAIHQENGAVVGALGSSFHTSNADLFAQADLSIAVDFVEFAHESPSDASSGALAVQSAVLGFTQAINTMRCTLRLPTMGSADAVVRLIAEGRRLQRNAQQALLFCLAFHLVVGCAYTLGLLLATPVDVVPFGMVLWFALAVVPAVAVAMHWTEAEASEMTKALMPRLRPGEYGWEVRKALEGPARLVGYFLLRAFPTAVFTVCVFAAVLVESPDPVVNIANGSDPNEVARQAVLWGGLPAGAAWEPRACVLAQNVAALVLALCALRLSMNALHRNQSIFAGCGPTRGAEDDELEAEEETFGIRAFPVSNDFDSDDEQEGDNADDDCGSCARCMARCQAPRCGAPARNTVWLAVVIVAVVLQVLINGVRDPTIGSFGVVGVPWGVWVAVLVWPVLMTGVDEGVKKLDARAFETFNRELRQLFETRLGMHSPQ